MLLLYAIFEQNQPNGKAAADWSPIKLSRRLRRERSAERFPKITQIAPLKPSGRSLDEARRLFSEVGMLRNPHKSPFSCRVLR